MTPNVPLLRKMVEWVEEQETRTEDREWDQFSYFSFGIGISEGWCETAFCVAGKVALDAGWQPDTFDSFHVIKGTERLSVVDVAGDLLGLPPVHDLFAGYNTAADIRRIAEDLAGERL